jgi:hypothetical protein
VSWTRVSTIPVLAALLAGGLAGCDTGTPSALGPDQAVTVAGRLVGKDGKPVARTRVALYRRPGVAETLGNLFVITASVGVACLADDPPALCRGNRRETTGEDGSFRFEMKGRDTYEGGTRNAAAFSLSAALAPHGSEVTGPDTTVSFKVQVADLHLPDVNFWEPALAYSGAGNTGRLTWSPPPTGLGDAPTYEAEFEDPAGRLAWAYPDIHIPASLDSRYLEDLSGGAAVHARAHLSGQSTTFDFDYRSQGVPFTGSAGPPLSRRRACFIDDASAVPHRLPPPCSLTDGAIGTAFRPPTNACRSTATSPCPVAPVAPYIDLGAPALVDTVVVRGCVSGCSVSLSDDGRTWREAGAVPLNGAPARTNGLLALQLAGAPAAAGGPRRAPSLTRARYARVTFPDRDASRLTEVSVWGPAGQALPPPTEPLVAPPSRVPGGHAGPARPGGGSGVPLLVAVNVVGLLVILAVVAVLLRRRGRASTTPPPPA